MTENFKKLNDQKESLLMENTRLIKQIQMLETRLSQQNPASKTDAQTQTPAQSSPSPQKMDEKGVHFSLNAQKSTVPDVGTASPVQTIIGKDKSNPLMAVTLPKSEDEGRGNFFQDLAPLLWNSFGTIAALLQEIVSIYPVLSPPNLTPAQSNRVCNALALLQCVASHPDTRMLFLNAHIPLYLYPFLNTTSKSRPFEYLRLTSLGVIGALVKVDDTEVIGFLLSTEIIPLCLRTMEMGSELSKTVATFILQKLLLDDVGLDYICTRAVKFFDVAQVLGNMVGELVEQHSSRLLKYIIRCYLRLSDNQRACDELGTCLPHMLRDTTFNSCLVYVILGNISSTPHPLLHPPVLLRGSSDEDVAARIASKSRWELVALQTGGSLNRIH
ncbi:Cell differentiation protein RCD1 -like protein [Capsicum chinense]|nr:Cell differentiation protein RCD1 -like protein [Capsicum chinense]